jgi:hypothetical protein
MKVTLYHTFDQHPDLKEALLATKDEVLTTVCFPPVLSISSAEMFCIGIRHLRMLSGERGSDGTGYEHFRKILEEVRTLLREQETSSCTSSSIRNIPWKLSNSTNRRDLVSRIPPMIMSCVMGLYFRQANISSGPESASLFFTFLNEFLTDFFQ